MLIGLLRALARLPLSWYHAVGAALAWIAYFTSPRFARRLRENLRTSGVCADEAEYRRVLRENIRETGKQAVEFIPLDGVKAQELADAAQLASLADETPEGRSIVVLAKEKYGLRGRTVGVQEEAPYGAHFVPFTAQTRMSGVDLNGATIRKGAPDAIYRRSMWYFNLVNSPATMINADDLENWTKGQWGLASDGGDWVSFHRNYGDDRIENGVAYSNHGTSEVVMRSQFQAWLKYMQDESAGAAR